MIKNISDIQNVPVSGVNSVVDYAVVMNFNDTDKTGRIIENNLSKEVAEQLCEDYNFYIPTEEFTVIENIPILNDSPSIKPRYCAKCGNSGINFGTTCSCMFNPDTFFSEVSCLDIPEQYRGIVFNTALIPRDLGEDYAKQLFDIFSNISTARSRNHNYLICSPHKHGKTVMAYSCIERLFRSSIPVFPVFDILEIRRIMNDVDTGRESLIEVRNPENIWLAPYLFVKIPTYVNWEVYDTINTLTSRRVRKGNSTIFLYSGTYSMLLRGDRNDLISSMRGDGAYSTLDVREWTKSYVDED